MYDQFKTKKNVCVETDDLKLLWFQITKYDKKELSASPRNFIECIEPLSVINKWNHEQNRKETFHFSVNKIQLEILSSYFIRNEISRISAINGFSIRCETFILFFIFFILQTIYSLPKKNYFSLIIYQCFGVQCLGAAGALETIFSEKSSQFDSF